eukprot:5697114-Amphidinium_carterae.1
MRWISKPLEGFLWTMLRLEPSDVQLHATRGNKGDYAAPPRADNLPWSKVTSSQMHFLSPGKTTIPIKQ